MIGGVSALDTEPGEAYLLTSLSMSALAVGQPQGVGLLLGPPPLDEEGGALSKTSPLPSCLYACCKTK